MKPKKTDSACKSTPEKTFVPEDIHEADRLTNLKENNSLVTIIEGNICDIIRGMPDYTAKGFRFDGPAAIYETRGQCVFRYGIEQKVRINEFSLNSSRRY
uniref:Uncharacterized protein n=1 Tax=Caenorhabditis japonica TaxID=281687 RepID=A0A8R1E629_CAEJA